MNCKLVISRWIVYAVVVLRYDVDIACLIQG